MSSSVPGCDAFMAGASARVMRAVAVAAIFAHSRRAVRTARVGKLITTSHCRRSRRRHCRPCRHRPWSRSDCTLALTNCPEFICELGTIVVPRLGETCRSSCGSHGRRNRSGRRRLAFANGLVGISGLRAVVIPGLRWRGEQQNTGENGRYCECMFHEFSP